eukprot:CAMPEP_0174331208 /NCGR_PEP_ID=MMETSP0810-20121108/17303_1 /TAXON_ID=73025 ORGANISM="Eutreptiella gymnastica-like, Strain CCMP1594" /NCGR_SAMPLE_ID=MMETSP0810 /ASSEMBLY_ACC=CAM_ASM_000659 /LENGTH=62 /DNA_ID=CAMNT_0015446857 /DNA_START=219 /DNA_END=407 /DNA_ORIENTATION=-
MNHRNTFMYGKQPLHSSTSPTNWKIVTLVYIGHRSTMAVTLRNHPGTHHSTPSANVAGGASV